MRQRERRGALFVMPRSSSSWLGAEALWITVAGWSAAAKRSLGDAWIITSDRIATPEEVIHFPLRNTGSSARNNPGKISRRLPVTLVTFLKDIILFRKRNRKTYDKQRSPWSASSVAFVWEQHDLFPGPGAALSKQLGVPFVIYVHAPAVWEARKWGVRRPVWGRLLETFVEARSLKKADVVACVSQEVVDKVIAMGVEKSRVIISPMAVDLERFSNPAGREEVVQKYSLKGKRVIGWTGSFRSFHGLDTVVLAFQKVNTKHPDTVLMLVGEGFEFENTKKLVADLNLSQCVIFPGKKAFVEIPSYVAAFDIALVSAASSEGFHYSPLKLREYLACGKPVIAPRAGNLPEVFADQRDLLFYEAGNRDDLAQKISQLLESQSLSEALISNAVSFFEKDGTWTHELKRVWSKLKINN